MIRLLFNEKLFNELFFYFSRSKIYWNQAKNLVGGAAQPQFNANVVSKILVPLPPLSEQKAIAKVLPDLDERIELNRKMNRTLEAIGQSLFKHWFIDFEFPNEKGKPYKSSGGKMVYNDELKKEIPEGWKVGRLGEYINEIESGSRPKGGAVNSGIPSIGAENVSGLGNYDYSSTKYVPIDFYNGMKKGKIKDFVF